MLADLFRMLSLGCNRGSEVFEALGFERDPRVTKSVENPLEFEIPDATVDLNRTSAKVASRVAEPLWGFPAYRVLRREGVQPEKPEESLKGVEPYRLSDVAEKHDPPDCQVLVSQEVLTTQLRKILHTAVETKTVNRLELVNRVARYQPLQPLPRVVRPRPGQEYWLLVDEMPGLTLDIDQLWKLFPVLPRDIRPARSIRLISALEPRWLDEREDIQSISSLPNPAVNTRFLLVSDKNNPGGLFRHVLQKWRVRTAQAKWLSPAFYVGEAYLGEQGVEISDVMAVERLMSLLYAYPRFTRAMVRQCRLAIRGPASAEILFWQHDDVVSDTSDCESGEVIANHREYGHSLERWHDRAPGVVRRLVVEMLAHTDTMPVWNKAVACLAFPSGVVSKEELASASGIVASLSSGLQHRNDRKTQRHLSSVVLSLPRRLQADPPENVAAAVAGAQQWWKQISPDAAARAGIPQHAMEGSLRKVSLHPDKQNLKISAEHSVNNLVQFNMQGQYLFADQGSVRRRISDGSVIDNCPVLLHTADEKIELDAFGSTDYHWAESLEQSASGLTLTTSEGLRVIYPSEPTNGPLPIINRTKAPQWLEQVAVDIDEHGLYATLNIFGIEQTLRWIPPGQFTMGSPEDEPGRLENETQREVVLSDGYWLADTCCTQSLWTAVMDANPSHFKGENLPVEQVSWEDVQAFFGKINEEYPALSLQLPTEAQWEYACRAGTSTAFSFGEISLDKANYFDGPEDADVASRLKGKTVDVATYASNLWGLYDMHGNVWEWCHDWYGPYGEDDVVNPTGHAIGEYRVLRGGSWFNYARNCRSACRDRIGPSNRSSGIGFRFAQVDQPKPAKRQPVESGAEAEQARRSRKSRAASDGILDSVKKLFRRDGS